MSALSAARRSALAGRAVASALAPLIAAGCLGYDRSPPTQSKPGERVAWDLVEGETDALAPVLSLWPAPEAKPPRLKRHMLTSPHGEDIGIEVSGSDPAFIWTLEEPILAGSFLLDVTSSAGTTVQLFWTGTICRSFKEECSVHVELAQGRDQAYFLLPPGPIQELRLDFAEEKGVKYDVHRMTVFAESMIADAFTAHEARTQVVASPEGLVVESAHDDPWIATELPSIPASLANTVELVLEGPPGAVAQVFWRGTACEAFDEACSRTFAPTSDGRVATSVDVGGSENWVGRIRGLRIDPGARGRYRIERIALVETARAPSSP